MNKRRIDKIDWNRDCMSLHLKMKIITVYDDEDKEIFEYDWIRYQII